MHSYHQVGWPGTYWLKQVKAMEKPTAFIVRRKEMKEKEAILNKLQPKELLLLVDETAEERQVRMKKIETIKRELAVLMEPWGYFRALKYLERS